jgi:hypothetical protein
MVVDDADDRLRRIGFVSFSPLAQKHSIQSPNPRSVVIIGYPWLSGYPADPLVWPLPIAGPVGKQGVDWVRLGLEIVAGGTLLPMATTSPNPSKSS